MVVGDSFFSYRVTCDADWRTRSVEVLGWIGTERFALSLVSNDGRWTRDGEPVPALDGCIDADLGFTPSTNTLPIRRLGLAVGEEAGVSAAWLRYPGLTLERLDQTYRRLGAHTWQYTSATGFTGRLEVDELGLVRTYEGGWAEDG